MPEAEEESVPAADHGSPESAAEAMLNLIDANDMAAFERRLAPYVRLRSLDPTTSESGTGRELVMQRVGQIGSRLGGRLGNRLTQRHGEDCARVLVTARIAMMTVRIGFEFTFDASRTVAIDMGLVRDPTCSNEEFVSPPKEEVTKDAVDFLIDLAPPYLVARPPCMPPPYLAVRVLRVRGELRSPYVGPRFINPYVKVELSGSLGGSSKKNRTRFLFKTKQPVWDESDDTEAFSVAYARCAEKEALTFTVWDHNIVGRNQWLARAQLPIASLGPCEPSAKHELVLALRRSSSTNESYVPETDAPTLVVVVQRFDVERWWAATERAAQERTATRDAAKSKGENKEQRVWWHLW